MAKTFKNVNTAVKKNLNAICGVLKEHLGIKNLSFGIEYGKCYKGDVIYLTSNDLTDAFGLLGCRLFKSVAVKAILVDGCYDNDNIYMRFDFAYTHLDGSGNGKDILTLKMTWDGICEIICACGMHNENGTWVNN